MLCVGRQSAFFGPFEGHWDERKKNEIASLEKILKNTDGACRRIFSKRKERERGGAYRRGVYVHKCLKSVDIIFTYESCFI